MAVHKERKVIFVHVIKTGGTSISLLLDEAEGKKKSGTPAAKKVINKGRRLLGLPIIGKHAYAIDYKMHMGREYDSYFKFAFVRNPWDWLVSWYSFVIGADVSPDTGKPWRHGLYSTVSGMSFDEFIVWVTENNGLSDLPHRKYSVLKEVKPVLQKDWVCDRSGNLIVDYVGRFERLSEDVLYLTNRIGIDAKNLKVTNKSRRQNYRSYYSTNTKRLVEKYFQEDLDLFGYTY